MMRSRLIYFGGPATMEIQKGAIVWEKCTRRERALYGILSAPLTSTKEHVLGVALMLALLLANFIGIGRPKVVTIGGR